MNKVKVRPVAGKSVPNPRTGGFIPEDGLFVDMNERYWRRRMKDGSIEVAVEKTSKPKRKKREDEKKDSE